MRRAANWKTRAVQLKGTYMADMDPRAADDCKSLQVAYDALGQALEALERTSDDEPTATSVYPIVEQARRELSAALGAALT